MTNPMGFETRKPLVVYHLLDGRIRCGASNVTKTLVGALQNAGYDVTLCFLYDGPVVEDAFEQGLPVRVVPCGNLFARLKAMTQICQDGMAKGTRLILHSHQLKANRFASFAAAMAKCHHVISIHTHKEQFIRDWFHNPLKRAVVRKLHYWTLKRADGLVAVSKGVHKELIELGYAPERARFIQNALNLPNIPDDPDAIRASVCQEIGIPPDSFIVVTAGRFVPLKRFDLLVRATALLSRQISNLQVVIAGDGPLRQELEELAKGLGVSNTVKFVGWRNDLCRFLSVADCVLSCSDTECSPVFLIEAMALERPVIAAAAEDIVHLIPDKRAGLLFPLGDLSGLCDALMEVARDPEKAQSMAKTGRRIIQDQFDTNASVREMLKLYSKVACSIKKQ